MEEAEKAPVSLAVSFKRKLAVSRLGGIEATIERIATARALPKASEEPPEQGLIATADATDNVLLLAPDRPFDSVREIISAFSWHKRDKIRMVNHWQGSFWQWREGRWEELDDEGLRSSIWRIFDRAERQGKRGPEPFGPEPRHITAAVDALKAYTNLPREFGMPSWIGSIHPDLQGCDLRECVAVQNGILHMPSRTLVPHTPRFWSPNVLDFAYDPTAKAPRFERFLDELWPNDKQTQQCVVEMIGLCLTDITKFHKGFIFVGPKRGGRGTMGRLIAGLIGKNNFTGSSFHDLKDKFGMEGWIGKKVVVFSDTRMDHIRPEHMQLISERILKTIGEDEQPINRKNEKYWKGTLIARIIIFSNELPRLRDDTGALPSRFITNRMKESFIDREQKDLTEVLLAERPGILNMALASLDRLLARDALIQPGTGVVMAERLRSAASDVQRFIEECCVIHLSQQATMRQLHNRFVDWCKDEGIRYAWGKNHLSGKLSDALPKQLTPAKLYDREINKRGEGFTGIGLKPYSKAAQLLSRPLRLIRSGGGRD